MIPNRKGISNFDNCCLCSTSSFLDECTVVGTDLLKSDEETFCDIEIWDLNTGAVIALKTHISYNDRLTEGGKSPDDITTLTVCCTLGLENI